MLALHIVLAVALISWTICGGIYIARQIKHVKINNEIYEHMEKHNDKY